MMSDMRTSQHPILIFLNAEEILHNSKRINDQITIEIQ